MTVRWEPRIGASVRDDGTSFRVWAPGAQTVHLLLEHAGQADSTRAMRRDEDGYHALTVPGAGDGALYRYLVDGRGPFPDPASRFQPMGVHGPSQVVDWTRYKWSDGAWLGLPLEDTILYELHVGAFTAEGTFAAATARLPALAPLGVTAVELMPVADFAGRWNWGYDGVALFAPAHCYGTPDDLRRLVDEAHRLRMGVYIDVVYNHLGPSGAYQGEFSPFYYSRTHESPWGAGINFDGPGSGPVREYVCQNALVWVHEFHVDGLRLDATHAIADESPRHVLAALSAAVRQSLADSPRRMHIVAEDTRNLAHMVKPEREAGWGLSGLWSDDFHHQMRRALAGDADGDFQDFDGTTEDIAATVTQGWFYTGQEARYFGGPRGTNPAGIPKSAFVFFLQNHDQVGNRAFGDRLHRQIDPAAWRAASVLLLILPETPLLFMGQEWAASTPFLYFTDHAPELGRLVTEGRRREFGRFSAFSTPELRESIPDPQEERTFQSSRLDWTERDAEPHASVLRLYERLIALRRQEPSLRSAPHDLFVAAPAGPDGLVIWRQAPDRPAILALVRLRGTGPIGPAQPSTGGLGPAVAGRWDLLLTTEDTPFAQEARPPRVVVDPLHVEFDRPGAAIFRAAPGPARRPTDVASTVPTRVPISTCRLQEVSSHEATW